MSIPSFLIQKQPFYLLGALLILFISMSQVAHADPHAMFYTVTGQQQLFFNTLAALDQAEYVEPAQDAIGTAANDSRSEVLGRREAAGFASEKDPVLNATKTDLSSILTRSITLEGNDVWSTYLTMQFALESVRRKNSAELIQIFCQRGLGLKECEENQEDPQVAEARKEHAYEVDPLTPRTERAGEAALLSGSSSDQAIRRDLLNPNSIEADKFRPYNSSVASLRDSAGNNPEKKALIDQWIENIMNASSGSVNKEAITAVSIDNNDRVEITNSRYQSVDGYVSVLASILAKPAELFNVKSNAENEQQLVDNVKIQDGIKADTYIAPEGASGGRIGQINEQLRAPAQAKIAQLNTAVDTIGTVNATRYYTDTQENIPGNTQIIDRNGEGSVQGISSDQKNSPQGQVKAITSDDGIDEGVIPEPTIQPEIPRDSNPISFNREQPIFDFLQALTGGSNQGGCGCSVDSVIQNSEVNIP